MKRILVFSLLMLLCLTSCTSQTPGENLSDNFDESVVSEIAAADEINSRDIDGNSSPISDSTAVLELDEPDYEYISFEQESENTFSAINGDIELALYCQSKSFAYDGDTYNNYEYTLNINNKSENIYELDCKNIYVSASGYSTETLANGSVYTLNSKDSIDYSERFYMNNDAPVNDYVLVDFGDMELYDKTNNTDYRCVSGSFICKVITPEE